ncbi:MAG TPA: hypothetical protein VFX16_05555 [Pseudonocardiaceae bacterium]|nr:hypothetical protein [Pseudonocardiaceae bacterium]
MPRNTYVRLVSGCVLAVFPSREPRLACLRALSSSYIHFGINGSCAGSVDHTHLTGSLTLPWREREARRLNTW